MDVHVWSKPLKQGHTNSSERKSDHLIVASKQSNVCGAKGVTRVWLETLRLYWAQDQKQKAQRMRQKIRRVKLRISFMQMDTSKNRKEQRIGISMLLKLNQNLEEPVALIGHGGFWEELTPSEMKE